MVEQVSRSVVLHAFVSVKGGVGKSALTVAAASILQAQGRRPIIVDADLTGTSLADGLELEAPELPEKADQLDLLEEPLGFLSRAETVTRRDARKKKAPPPGSPTHIPFFNDLLIHQDGGIPSIEVLAWRHEARHGLRVLPSSPLPVDVANALAWLYDEEQQSAWIYRLTELLFSSTRDSPVTDIIIDLPPGLFGFARQVLALMAHLSSESTRWPEELPSLPEKCAWRLNPLLVTSPDRNDLFCAMEAYFRLSRELPEMHPVVNRTSMSRSEVARVLEERFGVAGLGERFGLVSPHAGSLGRVFRQKSVDLDGPTIRELADSLRLEDRT